MPSFPDSLLNTIMQEDTITGLTRLPASCVDLVVTSPPYGVGKSYEQDPKGKREPFWKTIWLWHACFKQYRRILKPGGYLVWQFGDNTLGKAILGTEVHTTIPMTVWAWQMGRKVGLELQAERIWRKTFAKLGIPFICNHEPRPVLDYEHIWTFRQPGGPPQKVRDHKLSRRAVWDTTKDGLEELGEPMEKALVKHGANFPLAIPKWAITLYSDPGDVVVDNFMGTGTTAVAAEQLGRKWYGIERDPAWVAYSLKRIAHARAVGTQTRLEIS